MDKYPEIVWTNSPQTEKERLKMTRKVIDEGFYSKHGFVVLPKLDQRIDENAVVVCPRELEYKKINISKWEKEWSVVNNGFWDELERYLPLSKSIIEKIEIRLTKYGTIASGDEIKKIGKNKQVYYLRDDVDISHLAAMIINNILYLERKELGITWSKREALMDFVMTRPTMKKMFPKFRPIMHQLSRIPVGVRKQSERYLRELGVVEKEQELELINNQIMIRGENKDKYLTKKERVIMRLFLRNQGESVSYDQMADELWGEGEFRTFWAINKQVGRLRKKLEKLSVDSSRIQPVRGVGYVLV